MNSKWTIVDKSIQEHTRAYVAIDSESEAKSDGHDDLQAGRANKLRVEQLELKLKEAQKQVTRHVEACGRVQRLEIYYPTR